MENESTKPGFNIGIICNFCNEKFKVTIDKSLYKNEEEIKKIVYSTEGWCGQCVDGNS